MAALGIIRHASEKGSAGKKLVIAIEEPESHLHSDAIHKIKRVIDELSEKHQIIITTHNPLFVDRLTLSNNILVYGNQAKPTKKIESIRSALGVLPSDNLRNAQIALVVEGGDDAESLRSLLCLQSVKLRSAFENGLIATHSLSGGTNLSYNLGLLRNFLCSYHVFLDNDSTGKKAFDDARVQGLIEDSEAHFAVVANRKESELEDLYDPSFYSGLIQDRYSVSIQHSKFKSSKKWSDRVRDCFSAQGKLWDDRLENEIKRAISELVTKNPENAVLSYHNSVIIGLSSALVSRLSKTQAE